MSYRIHSKSSLTLTNPKSDFGYKEIFAAVVFMAVLVGLLAQTLSGHVITSF